MATTAPIPRSIWDEFGSKIDEDEDLLGEVLKEFIERYGPVQLFFSRTSDTIPSVAEFNNFLKDMVGVFRYLSEQLSDDDEIDEDALPLIQDIKNLLEYAQQINTHFDGVNTVEEIKEKLDLFYEMYPSAIEEASQASSRFIKIMGEKMQIMTEFNDTLEENCAKLDVQTKFLEIDIEHANLVKRIINSWIGEGNISRVTSLLSGMHLTFTPDEISFIKNFFDEVREATFLIKKIRDLWFEEVAPKLVENNDEVIDIGSTYSLSSSEQEIFQRVKDAPEEELLTLINENLILFRSASLKIKFNELSELVVRAMVIYERFTAFQ